MNKKEFIAYIAENVAVENATKKDAEAYLDVIVKGIAEKLQAGDKISLPGFGTFEVRERAERMGQNPSTGEKMTIPASKNVKFTPGKPLKDAVKNS
jgi:DNA-binding protein HU-beta